MGSETVATLVIVAIIVLALALYVFAIAMGLRRLSFTLGTIIVGLRAIREQTRPANPVLAGILNDVSGIESDLQGVLTAVGQALSGDAPAPEAAPNMQDAVAKARRAEPRLPSRAASATMVDVEEEVEVEVEDQDEIDYDEADYEDEADAGEEYEDYELEEGEDEAVPVGAGAGAGRSSMSQAVAAARARMGR